MHLVSKHDPFKPRLLLSAVAGALNVAHGMLAATVAVVFVALATLGISLDAELTEILREQGSPVLMRAALTVESFKSFEFMRVAVLAAGSCVAGLACGAIFFAGVRGALRGGGRTSHQADPTLRRLSTLALAAYVLLAASEFLVKTYDWRPHWEMFEGEDLILLVTNAVNLGAWLPMVGKVEGSLLLISAGLCLLVGRISRSFGAATPSDRRPRATRLATGSP